MGTKDEAMGARFGAYLVAMAAVGLVVSGVAWYAVGDLAAAFMVALLFGLAEILPARIREGIWATLGSVVVLAAILLSGPLLGICAVFGSVATWHTYPRRPAPMTRTRMTLFNVGQQTVAAGAAGLVFIAVSSPVSVVDDVGRWQVWVAVLAAAAAYTIVNHFFVAVAIHLARGEKFSSAFGGIVGTSMILQVLYAALAVLAAALWLGAGPWSLAFLVVPMLVGRQGLLAFQREEEAYENLVGALLKTIEVKDGYTAGHTDRVATLCVEVARECGLDYEQLRAVRYAAKLHDVGKLAVPSSIINKPGTLDEEEFERIKCHPDVGAEILAEVDFLSPIIDGVLYHHERVDGGGYPRGLLGDEIPLLARIITACDAFDAMTSTRSYREAMEIEDALAELSRHAGTQFDTGVVEILASVAERLGWQPTRDYVAPTVTARQPG
jgi:putative nucleotidyltransferase with HDIG domain